MTATLVACGVNYKRSILFQQSKVPMHAELCWVLSSITTMARLAHLPQFKEKSESLKNVPLGLYIYPVLQAADILLYKYAPRYVELTSVHMVYRLRDAMISIQSRSLSQSD